MIKKTVCYDSSPALHIAEARVIELSSGTSLAQFLMVLLTFEVFTFSLMPSLYAVLRRRCASVSHAVEQAALYHLLMSSSMHEAPSAQLLIFLHTVHVCLLYDALD